MELNLLNEFIHLANSLNYTESANALHVTQPTLSKHIMELERELGAKLFNRSSSNVELTEEGFYFLGVATDMTDSWENAKRTVKKMQEARPICIEGRFDDALVSGAVTMASSLGDSEDAPIVEFNHNRSTPVSKLLLQGKIDVLLDMMPEGLQNNPEVRSRKLFERPIVAIVDADNPLAEKSSLSISDLEGYTLVHLMWEAYSSGWDSILKMCEKRGFIPRTRSVPITSLAEGVSVKLDGGVLLYPSATKALKYLSASKRRTIPIDEAEAVFAVYEIYLAKNEERLDPFLKALEQGIRVVKGEHPEN